MIRHGTITYNEFLKLMEEVPEQHKKECKRIRKLNKKDKIYVNIQGVGVNLSSQRLVLFEESNVCTVCGLEGSFLAIEKHNEYDKSWHLNLYAIRDGKEVLMTKDHIQPKAKGGRDLHSNYVTMCHSCNEAKGDKQEWNKEQILQRKAELEQNRLFLEEKYKDAKAGTIRKLKWRLNKREHRAEARVKKYIQEKTVSLVKPVKFKISGASKMIYKMSYVVEKDLLRFQTDRKFFKENALKSGNTEIALNTIRNWIENLDLSKEKRNETIVKWILALGMEKQRTLNILKEYNIFITFLTKPLPDELWKKLYSNETSENLN